MTSCLCWFSAQGSFEVARFIPALTVSEDEINIGLERFGKALADVFPSKL